MTIFFTSDLHLSHSRVIELCSRPFASVEEMDETLIENWNSRVSSRDLVFVLGDLCMGSFVESIEKTKRLRGTKVLVPGNHDRVSSLYRGSPAKKAEWRALYEQAGFTIAPEIVEYSRLANLDVPVRMCHFPYEGDSHDEDRYAKARPVDDGAILLHGHTHAKERVRGRQIHVGIDAWSYYPVPEHEVLELVREMTVAA